MSLTLCFAALACGGPDESGLDELAETEDALRVLGMSVAPALQREVLRINNTETGSMIIRKAKTRGLHTIRVAPLPGAIEGLYSSRGVITIEDPNNQYTFQRLVHELLHAAGYHPHYYPDKRLVGVVCNQANAVCPNWN